MRILHGRSAEQAVAKLAGRASRLAHVEPKVKRIIADVRRRGNAAVVDYARKWDALSTQPLRVSAAEMRQGFRSLSRDLLAAVRMACGNIRSFAERQLPVEWMRTQNGLTVGQLVRPLDSVGCYVPGGRYPLPSTLLMTAIPAQVAGVPRICVVSPNPKPALLGIAHLLGIREFYRVGGAQAIAALAYGTRTIASVDRIVGPGNLYVTAAKKLVSFDCAIDMLAGPTEAVIVSYKGNPRWIAADLIAQSEHDPECLSIFITCSARLAKATLTEVQIAAESNPIARQALKKNACILIARSPARAMEWANRLAPEHITVATEDVQRVQSAGSVFVGDYSAQAAGDYASGPNHVLPTGAAARFRGGLSAFDFVKLITVQQLSQAGLRRIGHAITTLAELEGLKAHAESIRVRLAHA